MKKIGLALGFVFLLALGAFSQFTFNLVDNFEDGNFTESPKWWRFGDLKAEVCQNPSLEARDLIAESCGDYSLKVSGKTRNWYVGGIGTNLGVDTSRFSRFQIDLYGSHKWRGKLIIELFEDDNRNYSIEQDPQNNYEPVSDDKWVAEINIQGRGFTRTSIPFTAFRDANPGVGDDIWNPEEKDGSGGLLKLQVVAISEKQEGEVEFNIDNILLAY